MLSSFKSESIFHEKDSLNQLIWEPTEPPHAHFRSTPQALTTGEDMKSTDSALSSEDTGPCSSSDVTPSSETSLSDMSPASEARSLPTVSKGSSSTSKQLTALAQLVQEHYAYTSADASAADASTTTDTDGTHGESSQ